MVTANSGGTKKRKPPTFQHLPANRAKKLKRTWVEVQKIKSKWKAQKRKEGLVGTQQSALLPEDVESGDEQAAEQGQAWHGISHSPDEDAPVHPKRDENDTESGSDKEDAESAGESSEDVDMEDEPTRIARPGTNRGSTSRGRGSRGRGGVPRSEGDTKDLSLRELNRVAYSRSSLHTYKSRGRGDTSRGRGTRGRGRGQPDMRLRMNAMLEKIKRDFA